MAKRRNTGEVEPLPPQAFIWAAFGQGEQLRAMCPRFAQVPSLAFVFLRYSLKLLALTIAESWTAMA